MEIPADVLELIATHVKDNIRELEGALTRVVAYASLNRQPITLDLAEQLLIDVISGDQPRQITPKAILDATAETFGFSIDELCGQSRRRPLVIARQVGMYVFREHHRLLVSRDRQRIRRSRPHHGHPRGVQDREGL